MPTFTGEQLTSVTASVLDWYIKQSPAFMQSIQNKPLVDNLEGKRKDFPGGKGFVIAPVKGVFGAGGTNDSLVGYTGSDSVNFYTPQFVRNAKYEWKEQHIGITIDFTELKADGITVVDTLDGSSTRELSGRDQFVITGILDNKMADFAEQYARSLNTIFWGDGTADAKAIAGIRALITDDPTTGVVGGIDRATNAWWRNRAAIGVSAIASNVADGGALLQFLQAEFRQLRRYGGNPDKALVGSAFLGAMEKEMRANGLYTQNGFRGTQDAAMGKMYFGGIEFRYDPTLDDLAFSKRAYIYDSNAIRLMPMQNEWRRQHSPARPYNKFVLYRSITCTGTLAATQMNSSGVYAIT